VKLALFDFDGTLCRVNSWQVLLRKLVARPSVEAARLTVAIAARQARLIRSERLKDITLARFRGWTRAELDRYGQQFYSAWLQPALLPAALTELDRCRADGFRVVVISGAFDFLLAPFCAAHSIADWESTRIAFAADRCLGRLAGPEMRGDEKVGFLRRHFANEPVDWAASVAYSDELSDLPMLQAVGTGFVVGDHLARDAELPAGLKWGSW
jgi:HAD superfamily hydrolase (TIGR01490 family)